MICFKSRSNTDVLSQGQIRQLIYAFHNKIALEHISFALAQWIVRLVNCIGLLTCINRRYEFESYLLKIYF